MASSDKIAMVSEINSIYTKYSRLKRGVSSLGIPRVLSPPFSVAYSATPGYRATPYMASEVGGRILSVGQVKIGISEGDDS
jgi:hypothetical protein